MKKKPRKNPQPRQRRLAPVDLNQRYDIDEAAAYLRISRASLYLRISSGLIAVTKDASNPKRTFIAGSEIARLSQPSRPYSFAAATAESDQ
jgi:hypothetical protein